MHARSASSQQAPRSPAATVGPRGSCWFDFKATRLHAPSPQQSPQSNTRKVLIHRWESGHTEIWFVQMQDVAHRSHSPTQLKAPDGLARGSKAPRHAELVEDAGKRPRACPHTTTGRCVQQLAVRHRYHGPAYHQANRLDECGTYIILVLPPFLRQHAGKRLHRQPMPRKIGHQVRASDGLRVRRICPRSSPAVSHMPPRRATAGWVRPAFSTHVR